MWRMSLSTAVVMYGGALMALPLIVALLNTVGMGLVGGWIPLLALGAASAVAALALLTRKTTIALPRNIHILAGLPILVVSVASLVGRPSLETMVFGVSLETGTVGSFFLFASAIVCGSLMARANMLRLLDIFLGASAAGSVITFTRIAFLGWEHVELMNNVSLIICAALIVAVLRAEGARGRARLVYGACAFLFSALLFFTSSGSTNLLSVITLLAISAFVVWRSNIEHIPWTAVISTLFIGVLLLVGHVGKFIPTSPDVRPSLSVTSRLAGALYFQDIQGALLGIGPNGFHYAWEKHRVPELNASPLWQLSPHHGYSTAATFAVTMGMLGFLAFFLMTLSFVVFTVHRLVCLFKDGDAEMLTHALPAVALALFALAAMFTEVLESPLFLIGGVAVGMSVRALESEVRIIPIDFSFGGSRLVAGLIAIVALAMSALLLQASMRPVIAERFHARAVAHASVGDAIAPELFERAARIWKTPRYSLDASRAFVERARVAGEGGDTYGLRVSVEKAISYAGGATDSDPNNYEVWLYRGSLFMALISSGYPQAAENAYADIQEAKMRAPARPDVHYQEALLETARGRKVNARIALERAIELKPDYAEALSLFKSLSE